MPISIRGAREHNLRGLDVDIGDGLTVITGVSGSGKTSLAFDTLYREARRRFAEIQAVAEAPARLSPARVDRLDGVGPAVAVGQNLLNRNPASTLATASGLHPFLRLLYARFGQRHCRKCGQAIEMVTPDEVVARLLAAAATAGQTLVEAPLVRAAEGGHETLLALLDDALGPGRLRVDGRDRAAGAGALDPNQPHDIDVLLARIGPASTVVEVRAALEEALALGATAVCARSGGALRSFALAPVCVTCGQPLAELDPTYFHSPCPRCGGAGCEDCGGSGEHPDARATTWEGLRLTALLARPVDEAAEIFATSRLPESADRLHAEIASRLAALQAVGLGYVGLDRPSPTLSRGEAQRVRLAVALGSQLEDVLHVLDEPTIGQHPSDVARLLPVLRRMGGPTVVVEHDRRAAAAADEVIDLGPGAGAEGGRLLFQGPPAALWQADTPTGMYFSRRATARVEPPPRAVAAPADFLVFRGARARNLAGIDVRIPLGRLTAVCGVSGSGKSTLLEEVVVRSLEAGRPVGCTKVSGPALRPTTLDQSPIGRNPRSNPATYTKLADVVRDLFAARTGLSPSHFSFNRPEGACQECGGMGAVEVRLRYLPSVWVPCAACQGARFKDEVRAARARVADRELTIADLYGLCVADVAWLLRADSEAAAVPACKRILDALLDVGLGYVPLGQPSTTLSGGEAQRVKLAKVLGQRSLAGELLLLDEPTTGLHPKDTGLLLGVLFRLTRRGATVVVIEHDVDLVRAADWIVELGPGAGPSGGRLVFAGPQAEFRVCAASATARALADDEALEPPAVPARVPTGNAPPTSPSSRPVPGRRIAIRGARVHNLRDVDADIPKGGLTVVTGVSGSGKSSLVVDVLEAEARRRFLETLSMYERQSVREGPEALVDSVSGLGVTLAVAPQRRVYEPRATVGTVTEISAALGLAMFAMGSRRCAACGAVATRALKEWRCPRCAWQAPVAGPSLYDPRTYGAACPTCHGVGTLQVPAPEKLIVRPDLPLCAGAMHSPGFFPNGYLCSTGNGGYDLVQALAGKHGFDPGATPWQGMTEEARDAFLYGESEPMPVTYRGRSGRTRTVLQAFPGFYGWIRDWDVGGTYTRTVACPECGGRRLRPEYLAVTLAGHDMHSLSVTTLRDLARCLGELPEPETPEAAQAALALAAARRRLAFLQQVGLGYLCLDRPAGTLSAGEAQRVRLAALLGSGLTSLTVLLDEPTRGLHPTEVAALLEALAELRHQGNTVVVVEHDLQVIRAADHIIDMGPGAGRDGGRIVSAGSPAVVSAADSPTGAWLRGQRRPAPRGTRRKPRDWMVVRGARANNLRGQDVSLPLGVLAGLCGVSGSGKSTLAVDTLARVLAPAKQTTSVAYEPVQPGDHDGIDGAPGRTVIVDQGRAGVHNPLAFMGLDRRLRKLFAASPDALALGLDEAALARRCSTCMGRGSVRTDMVFLPDIETPCDVCGGTGEAPEAWQVRLHDVCLPELMGLTVEEAAGLFADVPGTAAAFRCLLDVGLGYLVLRQPGRSLSGGEAQRLKIARELARPAAKAGLYILDEPTVGQHLEDVRRLVGVLDRLVDAGHSVLVIEHHPHVLAACDWLVEMGPGGGPDGGLVVASGTPERLAAGTTATAPYVRLALEEAAP